MQPYKTKRTLSVTAGEPACRTGDAASGKRCRMCEAEKSPGAPLWWCAGAVLLDWSHSLIPCIRCMRIMISRTCGLNPLRCEGDFSDPIDRIFQGLPLDLGIALKRGVECYPGICVSSSIRLPSIIQVGRPFKFVSVSICRCYVETPGKEALTTSLWVTIQFCLG